MVTIFLKDRNNKGVLLTGWEERVVEVVAAKFKEDRIQFNSFVLAI